LIAGDETSKNKGRTSNKNMNKKWLGQGGRRGWFNLKGEVLIPVGNTNRD
jgi:hypothetical protein